MYFKLLRLSLSAATTRYTNFNSFCTTHQLFKFVPDKSKVPPLVEDDIEEQFVTGSGPGGQNVNRLQNCAHLRHIPTGKLISDDDLCAVFFTTENAFLLYRHCCQVSSRPHASAKPPTSSANASRPSRPAPKRRRQRIRAKETLHSRPKSRS